MTTEAKTEFQLLMEEADGFFKSLQPADAGKKDDKKKPAEGGNADLLKSLRVMIDGQEQEAFDGAKLVGALIEQVEEVKAQSTTMAGLLQKSLGLLKSATEETAALKTQVTALADAGRGRKSAIVAPAANGGQGGGAEHEPIDSKDFMAKSESLFAEGKLKAHDLALIETSLNRREAPPARITKIVLEAMGRQLPVIQ